MTVVDVHPPATVWESAATTRWGRYITEVVESAVWAGVELAGPPKAAMEIGCEGGRWSRLLAGAGWTMTCTDVDPNALAVCQGRLPGANCILVPQNATTLPCASGSMNLLLCLEVFPVMDSQWFPPEAFRVLAADGVLVGITQNLVSLRGAFVRIRQHFKSVTPHFYNISYVQWRRRIRAAGFEITFQRGYCWFPLTRASDSKMTPLFVNLERWLGLGRCTFFSPWVVFIAKKPATTPSEPRV